jgi:epoxyqueuosine reductase QueG
MHVDTAREFIAQAALEIGFDAVGWAGMRVPDAELTTFRDWIGAGMHAGMDYLPKSLSRRSDVTTSFAPTLGVLALMVSHNHADPGAPDGGVRVGRVARYAWSRDYHTSGGSRRSRRNWACTPKATLITARFSSGVSRCVPVWAGADARARSSAPVWAR